jgi:iron complex outermembrane recepter protein
VLQYSIRDRLVVFFWVLCVTTRSYAAVEEQVGSLPTQALQEIVVTAERRESTVQSIAGSVTAVSGDQILGRGFADFSELAATIPGLSFATGGPGQTEYALRGVANPGGNSPTTGFYLDDTPLTAAANSNSGKVVIDPNLYDVSRVEVLRGPQGTLYGASSMGGTIKIITNPPDTTQFRASADSKLSDTDGGGFNHSESGMVNVPLASDLVGLRVVASERTASGWIDRIVVAPGAFPPLDDTRRGDVVAAAVASRQRASNRIDEQTVRATLLVKPMNALSITPSVFYQHVEQRGPSAFDTIPGALAHYEAYDIPEPYREHFLLGSLNVQYHAEGVDFTSNTADFDRQQTLTQDETEALEVVFGQTTPYLAGPVAFQAEDGTRQFSQEFRAASSGMGRFKWQAGIFYSDLESTGHNMSRVQGLVPLVGTDNLFMRRQPYSIKQSALFGEVSYQITRELTATMGVRGYHYDTKVTTTVSGVASVSGGDDTNTQVAAAKDSGANPKFDLTYAPTGDLTLYATVARGFRPGGGDQLVPTNSNTAVGAECAQNLAALGLTASPTQYRPDSLWSYELGEKLRLFERRLSVNASVYDIEWGGIQQGVGLNCGFGFTTNAGRARIRGSEVEMKAQVAPGLQFDASAGFIDGALTEGSSIVGTVAGQPLQSVPKWTGNTGITLNRPLIVGLDLVTHLEYNYIGRRFESGFLALTPTPAYELMSARIGVAGERWSAHLFVDNLLNKKAELAFLAQQAASIPLYDRAVTNQPRTIGMQISARY